MSINIEELTITEVTDEVTRVGRETIEESIINIDELFEDEQPVAEVQEVPFEFDDEIMTEGITDPQAVADVLSGGQIYPGPTPTLEEFRDLVQALETPGGQTYHQVDLNMLPSDMTPNEYVQEYHRQGLTMPVNTRFVDGIIPITTEPQIVPVVEEVKPEPDELPFPTETYETRKQIEAREEEAHDAERIKMKKEIKERRLRVKRKKLKEGILYHTQHFIKKDEIMFFMSKEGNIGSARFDTIEGSLEVASSRRTMEDEYTEESRRLLTSSFIFDKNMNGLILDYSRFNETPNVNVNVIDTKTTFAGGAYSWNGMKKWITIDKHAFLSSGGKEFKLKSRVGYSYQEVLELKRKIASEIKETEEFISHLKKTVGEMYDEENFEILYSYKFNAMDTNHFEIFLQFPNLTVTNSIEMTHNIDNMIVKMQGEHHYGVGMEKNSMLIERNIDGLRTAFTPEDAHAGYSHSHLPGESEMFEDFCMGDEHFMVYTANGIDNDFTTDVEFELMLIAVFDHISWESLEGGPYRKMEEIGGDIGQEIVPEDKLFLPIIYTKSNLRIILNHLHRQDMNGLLKAFELRLQGNGEVGYEYNKLVFIEELDILMNGVMMDLHDTQGTNLYLYTPSTDKFTRNNGILTTPKHWTNIVEHAEKKMEKRPIVYMNGDYIIPEIVKTDSPTLPTVYSIPSLHPTLVLYFANIIKYHLLNELKNVK